MFHRKRLARQGNCPPTDCRSLRLAASGKVESARHRPRRSRLEWGRRRKASVMLAYASAGL